MKTSIKGSNISHLMHYQKALIVVRCLGWSCVKSQVVMKECLGWSLEKLKIVLMESKWETLGD